MICYKERGDEYQRRDNQTRSGDFAAAYFNRISTNLAKQYSRQYETDNQPPRHQITPPNIVPYAAKRAAGIPIRGSLGRLGHGRAKPR